MKISKLFLLSVIFLSCICVVSESWYLLNSGFRIDKINDKLTDFTKADDNFNEASKIFNQKFKYLSKGCQTYVFESEDSKYVIKFIRYHRYSLPFWLKVCDFLQDYKIKRQRYKASLLNASLNSYNAAYKFLKDETATVYVHLHKTGHINKKIQILDKLNRKYWINLDTTGFLVQRKAKNFSDVLEENKNNDEELKKLTCSFLQTTKSIYLKGFNNDDYNCVKNSGYIDNRVIHTDVGSFLEKNLSDKRAFEKEFTRFVAYFKKWAEKNAPELIGYVDEEIKKMSDNL